MKKALGWHWPDGEKHMLEWMGTPKNKLVLNGRETYQGRKQVACLEVVRRRTTMRTAVDIGAHIGLWSWNLSHWFKEVHAFEPMATHRECFEANTEGRQHVGCADMFMHAVALGDKAGSVSMQTNPTSSGDTWVKGEGDIPLRTLDSFDLQDVDFIKADCEGFEEFAMRGAEATIKKWKPVICIEQKRDMATKFGLKPQGGVEYLKSLGYTVAFEIAGDYIMVPR